MTDKDRLTDICVEIGLPAIDSDWSGVDVVLPLLEKMRLDGAIVLLKIDGERGPGDNGPYTALVSGRHLGPDGVIRIDANTLEEALAYVIVRYATAVWGYTGC